MEQKILPIFQVIISCVLMYILALIFPVFNYILPFKHTIIISLIGLSILIGLSAIISFKKHKTTVNPTKPEITSIIVDTGIYAYSRNPMYLALLICLIAFSIFCGNFISLFPNFLFIWFITQYQIKYEERVLTEHFNDDYKRYLKDVRRWL